MANAYLDRGKGCPRRLAFWGILLKLCMIPFYLLVFIGGLAMSIGMAVVPGLILGAPVTVGVLATIDYALLLLTSSYGFAAAARAYRQRLISRASAVALAIPHALFVTDVAASIVLYMKIRKADSASGFGGGEAAS